MTDEFEKIDSSFRDPSGFLFRWDGNLFRQVNRSYQKTFDQFITSGLYADLINKGWLVAHEEVSIPAAEPEIAYKIIKPSIIPFISYPYEWSFSQLKDAALLTLEITQQALAKGMILKDASAYNIQFLDGKPVLIDSLSFDSYQEGKPWDAYRQFCQHFLAPLALASLVDIRLTQLMRVFIDGIPLDLASQLLPGKTRLGLSGLALHIHMHSRMQRQFAVTHKAPPVETRLPKQGLVNLLHGLRDTIAGLNWEPKGTEWGDYYSVTNYSTDALRQKGNIVGRMIEAAAPASVWDLGANNGLFSREVSNRGIFTVASDIDPAAVEKNYLTIKNRQEKNLLPLVVDLTNPSAASGWANQERESFSDRGPVDMVMALALIHHLAISNNVPLANLAAYFASLANWAIVEFVPKSDSQVHLLLKTRKDIFPGYSESGFEELFTKLFTIEQKVPEPGSERTLYLFKKK